MKKQIILIVGGTEFKFLVSIHDYNDYVNGIKADDKVAPSIRFVRGTLVDREQLPALNEFIDQGLAIDLAGALLEEFRPKVEIEVKK